MITCGGAFLAFVSYLVPIVLGMLIAWLLPWHPLAPPTVTEEQEDLD